MNLIVILADDVGAETVGAYGGESYQTPRLDQMAQRGVLFEQGHAQPLCTPSRVKVMTGKYNFRNYTNFGYLDPAEKTFAHLLRDTGYSTAVVGKWQLHNNPLQRELQGALPAQAGFDEYLLWQLRNELKSSRYWGPLLDHNGEIVQHPLEQFGPDLFNDYALNYIEAHREEPFFLYYPMVLVHDPWTTTPDMGDENASDQEKFAAMMSYMDKLVGKVVDKVEEQGIADRTAIFFIGDNGTGNQIVSRYKGQDIRGGKHKTLVTGTRVPFIAWVPSLGEAVVSESLVNLNDIMPTLAELAGIEVGPGYGSDGKSLVPVLSGQQELSRDSLFIHFESRWRGTPSRYVFDQRWKLYQRGDFYDLQTDPDERSPLNVESLSDEAGHAYHRLATRLENMEGTLGSSWAWVPTHIWLKLLLAALVSLVVVAIIGRLILRVYKGKQQ